MIKKNKIIPKEIAPACIEALSYYPDLTDTHIEFKFQKNTFATMLAQPKKDLLFRRKKHRRYIIRMNNVKDVDCALNVMDLPYQVQVGWLGHELGHIVDYSTKHVGNMMLFGVGYLLFHHFRIGAERIADLHAIHRGMGEYILSTKNYILSHKVLSERYKQKIRNFYISPEETSYIIDQIKEKNLS